MIANGYVVEGRSNGRVELRREQDGTLVWSGSAGTEILPTDEHNAFKLVGLALGDGALVVPAGTRLTVFVPGDQPTVTITGGPEQDQLVGPQVSFTFTSDAPDATYTCDLDRARGDRSDLGDVPCTSSQPALRLGASRGHLRQLVHVVERPMRRAPGRPALIATGGSTRLLGLHTSLGEGPLSPTVVP